MSGIRSTEPRYQNTARTSLLVGLGIYWIFLLHIAWPNHGKTGIYLPYNQVAWGVMSTLCAIFWFIHPGKNRLVFGPVSFGLFAGALLMTLPLMWSPSAEAVSYALPRMAGLWAGLAFWFTLRQCHFSASRKTGLLYCFVGAGVVESVIVLLELKLPTSWLPASWGVMVEKYGRYGTGVFQQVNVTTSFLSLTLAGTLLLLGLRWATLPDTRRERLRQYSLATATVLISAVITTVYSRIGWLSAVVVVVAVYWLLTWSRFRQHGCRQRLLLCLPLTGIIVGILLMKVSVGQALDIHDGSNHQRLLTLYHTILYASHHPFLGYGAGTYEGYYQAYLAGLPGGNPGAEIMEHPHNEFLYQYTEGGIVALAGALLWGGIYVWLWRKARNVLQAGAIILSLPLLLHTQVEFPLYYSVPHWLALLTLLRLADREYPVYQSVTRSNIRTFSARLFMLLLALYGVSVAYQAFQTGNILDRFESNELSPREAEMITTLDTPWVFQSRYALDLTLLRLVRFSATHDRRQLYAFTQENEKWLTVYASADMYSNQIAVLNYLNDKRRAEYWQTRARRMQPWVAEFH